jgi:hypothetical protein
MFFLSFKEMTSQYNRRASINIFRARYLIGRTHQSGDSCNLCYLERMPRGNSGRIVINIDPDLKHDLYVKLAQENSSLKTWFIKVAKETSFGAKKNGRKSLSEEEEER